jgi:glycerophosphoryl diester phosphodiesterase
MNQVIAHRGASAYAPENTMAAFQKAFDLGARFVEFDVMLSVDGHPFIFHDDTLKRTTNGRGDFGKVTAEYIQSLDAGRWFSRRYAQEKVPSFLTVLEWLIANEAVQANIEIKPYPGTAEQTTMVVLTYLNRYWPADKPLPLVSCFDPDVLTLCRQLSPEMPLGLLMHKWQPDWLLMAKALDCKSVHLNYSTVTRARLEEIKIKGYLVYVYTINHRRRARRLLEMGVDAIFSDYPDLLGVEHV